MPTGSFMPTKGSGIQDGKVARTVAFWGDEKANTHKRTASRAASLQEMERELRGAKR